MASSELGGENRRAADQLLEGVGHAVVAVVAMQLSHVALMSELRLDPTRQLLGAQCPGTLILAKLGLLDGVPAWRGSTSRSWRSRTSRRRGDVWRRRIWRGGSFGVWEG